MNTAEIRPVARRQLNVKMLMQLSLVALLLVVWTLLSFTTTTFATSGNITNLLRHQTELHQHLDVDPAGARNWRALVGGIHTHAELL